LIWQRHRSLFASGEQRENDERGDKDEGEWPEQTPLGHQNLVAGS
jgi:hypothetical protein